MELAVYSPEDVVILLGGVYQIEGLHEGSFISIEPFGDRWTTSVSTDGRVTRTHTKNPTYTVTITLSSTSDANSIFSAWASADGLIHSAALPLLIRDGNGSTLLFASMCWVERIPTTTFGVEVEGREWVLRTAGTTLSIGGNEGGGLGVSSGLMSAGFIAADMLGLV